MGSYGREWEAMGKKCEGMGRDGRKWEDVGVDGKEGVGVDGTFLGGGCWLFDWCYSF